MWKPLHEALELEDPVDLGIDIEVTDVLPPARVREVFAAARSEPGRCAIIVAEGARLTFLDEDAPERLRETLAAYERGGLPFGDPTTTAAFDAALASVAAATGVDDPLRVLHRLDGDTIMAIGGDEEVEFDEEMLLPDDLRVAYDEMLEARKARRAAAIPGMLTLDQQGPLRTYDEATAIAELGPGDARVFRLATTPARALMYLGFGGWNDCPNPHEQARAWEHWATTVGGVPAVIHEDALDAIIARPPTTRDALVRMAHEVVTYDRDSGIEGMLWLLATLYRSTSVRFWWD